MCWVSPIQRSRSAWLIGYVAVNLAFSLSSATSVAAASISVIDTESTLKVIVIEGEIVDGDYLRFMDIARDVRSGGVLLSSPGGSLREGLDIGRAINDRGLFDWRASWCCVRFFVRPDVACRC